MTTIAVDLEGHMTYTAEKVVHQKGAQQKHKLCMKILRDIQIIILDWSIFITLAGQFMRHSEGYLTLKEI